MSAVLYGVPLSQPFRAVLWPLLARRVPFEVALAIPGSDRAGVGLNSDEIASLNPRARATIPMLRLSQADAPGGELVLCESHAILAHLGATHGWDGCGLAPQRGTAARAVVDEYLHWHHGHTRQITHAFFAPVVRPDLFAHLAPEAAAEAQRHAELKAVAALDRLENGWLGPRGFAGTSGTGAFLASSAADGPTIADVACYEEVRRSTAVANCGRARSPAPPRPQPRVEEGPIAPSTARALVIRLPLRALPLSRSRSLLRCCGVCHNAPRRALAGLSRRRPPRRLARACLDDDDDDATTARLLPAAHAALPGGDATNHGARAPHLVRGGGRSRSSPRSTCSTSRRSRASPAGSSAWPRAAAAAARSRTTTRRTRRWRRSATSPRGRRPATPPRTRRSSGGSARRPRRG
jgi:glutathione S-transferase